MRAFRAIAGAAVLAALASPALAAGRTYTVQIHDMTYAALPSGLRVGDTLVWVNADIFRHSVTANDKSFDLDLPPGKRGTLKLGKAGQIVFFCRFHPGMKGTLIVKK